MYILQKDNHKHKNTLTPSINKLEYLTVQLNIILILIILLINQTNNVRILN